MSNEKIKQEIFKAFAGPEPEKYDTSTRVVGLGHIFFKTHPTEEWSNWNRDYKVFMKHGILNHPTNMPVEIEITYSLQTGYLNPIFYVHCDVFHSPAVGINKIFNVDDVHHTELMEWIESATSDWDKASNELRHERLKDEIKQKTLELRNLRNTLKRFKE